MRIGFYLSGHPFAAYAAELATIVRTSLAALAAANDRVLVAGIVTRCAVQTSRRGKMAFVTLDDGKGRAEIDGLQRDVRRGRARCCARTSSS